MAEEPEGGVEDHRLPLCIPCEPGVREGVVGHVSRITVVICNYFDMR
ncbi:hypothetical protein JOE37_001782 [Clavibacter michiganensis]|nr:hypothetical protein [Clavibacter michiganensis]